MRFACVQKSEGRVRKPLKTKRRARRTFGRECDEEKEEGMPSPGNLYGYQKKGVVPEANRMNVKRKQLAADGQGPKVWENGQGGEKERDGASKSRTMVAQNVYKVNKIILRLRSNAGRRQVADR